jgi:hypothetical protein
VPPEATWLVLTGQNQRLSRSRIMSGEHGIPCLSSSSQNWTHISTMLHSHLSSIGEFRLLDFNYTLLLKEVMTKTSNPEWVSSVEAPSASSEDSGSSGTSPVTKAPVMSVPQLYNVSHWESSEMVESYSPALNTLSNVNTVPFNLLNQQLISIFARLVDKSLHHLLAYPASADPHATARNVFMNIRKHFEAQEWIS